MRFDLTDLHVFLHACEGGSMTEGARRAHLTLAAISARIRALEDSAGVPLLHRHARGVAATAAGQALARHARLVLHEADTLARDLATPGEQPQPLPTVLLGNSSSMARPLGGAVARVLAQHPRARIHLRESASEATVHALRSGAADLGIISDSAATYGLRAEPLGPDPLVLVAARTHALAAAAMPSFADLLAHEWIGWAQGSALQTHLAMQAFRVGLPIRYKAMLPAADAVLELVARGAGIAVMPACLVVRGHVPELRAIALNEPWARRTLLLCWKAASAEAGDGADEVAQALAHSVKARWEEGGDGS